MNMIVHLRTQEICDMVMKDIMPGVTDLTPEDNFRVISLGHSATNISPAATTAKYSYIYVESLNPKHLDSIGMRWRANFDNDWFNVRSVVAGLKSKKRKKTPKKTKPKKKSRKKRTKNKTYHISVKMNKFSDELYKYFKKMKINKKHNFINFISETKGDKVSFTFTSRQNKKYNSDPKWSDIHCKEYKLNNKIIIKTDCDRMEYGKPVKDKSFIGFFKVFVKGYQNLYDYIKAIQQSKLNKKDHTLLFDILIKNQRQLTDKSLINHNLDVKTLHFKYV